MEMSKHKEVIKVFCMGMGVASLSGGSLLLVSKWDTTAISMKVICILLWLAMLFIYSRYSLKVIKDNTTAVSNRLL